MSYLQCAAHQLKHTQALERRQLKRVEALTDLLKLRMQPQPMPHILTVCYMLLLIQSDVINSAEFPANFSLADLTNLPKPELIENFYADNEHSNGTHRTGHQILQNLLNFLFPNIFTTTEASDDETTTAAPTEETTTTTTAETTTTAATTSAPTVVVNNNTAVYVYVPVSSSGYNYPYYSYPYYGYGSYGGYGYGYPYYGYGYYG